MTQEKGSEYERIAAEHLLIREPNLIAVFALH